MGRVNKLLSNSLRENYGDKINQMGIFSTALVTPTKLSVLQRTFVVNATVKCYSDHREYLNTGV